MYFRYKLRHIICISLIILLILAGMKNMISEFMPNLLSQRLILYPTNNILLNLNIFLAFTIISISVFHQLTHGLMYEFFGGNTKYSFNSILAIVTETTGVQLTKSQFVLIQLMPVTFISVISLIFPYWLGAFIFLCNLLLSANDIYVSLFMITFTNSCIFVKKDKGFQVINIKNNNTKSSK